MVIHRYICRVDLSLDLLPGSTLSKLISKDSAIFLSILPIPRIKDHIRLNILFSNELGKDLPAAHRLGLRLGFSSSLSDGKIRSNHIISASVLLFWLTVLSGLLYFHFARRLL